MSADARFLGRYAIHAPIASGGSAVVHLGRLLGPVGFSKVVAIKLLREELAKDTELVERFLAEARLAARIQHPNVISTLDVIAAGGEVGLVMEYVPGESLSALLRAARAADVTCPPAIAVAIVADALRGLSAAHEAQGPRGEPLGLVHRDVSPQNILVGADGAARVLDFGIAKVIGQAHNTRTGVIKGKLAYLAPELLGGGPATVHSDLFAVGAILWEALAGKQLFERATDVETLVAALETPIAPPSTESPALPVELDAIVGRALARDPAARYANAQEMADALESTGSIARARAAEVADWVRRVGKDGLAARGRQVRELEASLEGGIDAASGTSGRAPAAAAPAPEEPTARVEPSRAVSPSPPTPATARRTLLAGAIVLGVGAVVVLGLAARSGGTSSETPPPEPSTRALATAAPTTATAEPGPAAPSTEDPPEIDPSPSGPRPRAAPAGRARRPVCDPPYSVDDAGRRHYRAECLRGAAAR